jgi:hypothetical protein
VKLNRVMAGLHACGTREQTLSIFPTKPMVVLLKKVTFIKLQKLVIGYTLPKSVLNRMKVENLRIFAQGQDMWMGTKYTGIDPEMENNGWG